MAVSKDRAQDVKKIVDEVKRRGRGEATSHTVVHRPWGSYQTVDSGPRFQVKRIIVKRAPRSRCRNMPNAPSIGWWSAAPRASPAHEDTLSCARTCRPIFRWARFTGWKISAPSRCTSSKSNPAVILADDIVRLEDSYGRK